MRSVANQIDCFAVSLILGVLTQVHEPPHHPRTGFDFPPLSDPPKIKCGGWISGKGV